MNRNETSVIDRNTYDQLRDGMSLEAVEQLLGVECDVLSEHVAQMEPGIPIGSMSTVVREWKSADGSTVRILFRDDKLLEKSSSHFDEN